MSETLLQNFRAQYPAYSDMSDAELSDALHSNFYSDIDRRTFNEQIGYSGQPQGEDGVHFLEAVKAGVENLGGSGIALKAGVANLLGNEQDEAAALDQFARNREKVAKLLEGATDWRDILDADSVGEGFSRTLDFIKEQFGLNSPQMVTIMAGGAGGALAAPYLPHPLATAVSKVGGFTVGATMTALPMFTGFNVGRQIDEGKEIDIVKAGALAIPQAAAEAFLAKVFTTTGLTKVGQRVLGDASESTVKRIGQKIGEALAVGVPGEVIQQGFERAAADLDVNPLESEEALTEYVDAAISAAAALSPMGTIAGIPGGRKTPNRNQEDIQKIVEEEVVAAKEPAQNIIKTHKEAKQALKSLGINPEAFTPEAAIKAANLQIDKIDNNRTAFLNNLVPESSDLKGFLQQSTALSPLKSKVNQKIPLDSVDLENVNNERKTQELAAILPPNAEQFTPTPPRIDTEASPAILTEQGRVTAEIENNAFSGSDLPNNPTISDLPGQIAADMEQMAKPLRKIARLPKADLVKLAQEEYKIPIDKMKNKMGKIVTKDDIMAMIVEERAKKFEAFQPQPMRATPPKGSPNEPLNRVTPEQIDSITTKVDPIKQPPEVTKKMKPVVDQVKRIGKENKTPINIDADLTVDSETKVFTKPIKAAQAANFLFTSVNYNNVANYPNIDPHLQETWEYYYDKLSKTKKSLIKDNLKGLRKAVDGDNTIGINNIERWTQGELGERELLSHGFAAFAQGVRTNSKDVIKVPQDIQSHYSRLVRMLEKSKAATRGLGMNTFEDVFSEVSETGVTPREAVFDSIDKLREQRLKGLSDEIQLNHWKELDRINIRTTMQEAIKAGVKGEAMKKTSLYARSMFSSMAHASSRNPVISIAYNLRREQETFQSNLLTQFADNGEAFFREPSKKIRMKAADTLDHLRTTDQKIQRDSDGAIVFERDGNIVRLTHPDMIRAIESLQSWSKGILDVADGEVRSSINELVDGTLTLPISEIKKSVDQIEQDNSLDKDDLNFLQEQVEVLENIQRMKKRPFVPRMRFGSYGFTVHAAKNIGKDGKVKPDAKPIYHAQVESGRHKGRWEKTGYENTQKTLAQYRGSPEYVIFEDKKSSPYEMTYSNMYDRVARDNITLEMLSGLLGSDKTEDYFVDVKRKLDNKTRFRGFRKRFGEAENIPGYSTDWDRVINGYNMGAAHFFAKARYAPLLQEYSDKVQSEMSDEHAWVKRKTTDYIEHTNSPHDSFQSIRTINFLWTMGGNFSTALLQVMTLPTTSLGSMTQFNSNKYQNAKLLGNYFKIAFKEFADSDVYLFQDGVYIFRLDNPELLRRFKNKHGFTDDEITFVQNLFKDGRTGASFLEEQTGKRNFETRTTTGQLKDQVGKFSHFLGTPISAMEQATRFATAMAHYKLFKENPEAVKKALKVLENDHRFQAQRKVSDRPLIDDLTYFGIDEAHAVFGKVGRGGLLRGGLGAFVFPFMTYPQNALEFMVRMGLGRGPGGKEALVTTAASLFLFSGLIGLPGGELAKELLEEAYKLTNGEEVDLDFLIREKLTEATGDPRPGLFVTQGAFRAFLNMDVSRRIGLPIVGQDLLLAMMGVRGDMSDLLGVQGSMLTQGFEAWRAYSADESHLKVATHLTPMAVSNLLKAYNYTDSGVRTTKGTQLVSAKEIIENPVEVMMRALGITTGRVASAREEQYWRQTENTKTRPKMDSFRARGKNYVTKQLQAIRDGRPKDAEHWRGKYQELLKDVTGYLNKKKIPYNMGAFHRSVFDSVDQRVSSSVRMKDLNKGVRHRKETLSKVSGRERFN